MLVEGYISFVFKPIAQAHGGTWAHADIAVTGLGTRRIRRCNDAQQNVVESGQPHLEAVGKYVIGRGIGRRLRRKGGAVVRKSDKQACESEKAR